jgi:hypothetical protein
MAENLFCLPLVVRQGMTMHVKSCESFNPGQSWFRQLLLALTLFLTTGCGDGFEYEETIHEIYGGGIISDTTVIFFEQYVDSYYKSKWIESVTDYRNYEMNLVLADIRFEKIYWKKSVKNALYNSNYGSFRVQAIDSVLIFYATPYSNEKKYRIAVVNMDEKFHQSDKIELKPKEIKFRGEAWEDRNNETFRPWKDGLLLARRVGASSPYALIDTAAGTMELWQPAGEYEWLNDGCSDFKWSRVGGLCLKEIPDTVGFVLLRNGVDTLGVRLYADESSWILPFFYGNGVVVSGGWMCLINEQGQVSEKLVEARYSRAGRFYNLAGNLLVDYNK